MQHSAIWMAGVYLMLLMQFLENQVAVELTRSEFVEAQEVACLCFFLLFLFSHPWALLHVMFVSNLGLQSAFLISMNVLFPSLS